MKNSTSVAFSTYTDYTPLFWAYSTACSQNRKTKSTKPSSKWATMMKMNTRVDGLEAKMVQLNTKVDGLVAMLEQLNTKVDRIGYIQIVQLCATVGILLRLMMR